MAFSISVSHLLPLALLSLLALQANIVSGLTYKGADISSLTIVEQDGVTFKDVNGNAGKLENILHSNGMNVARVRVWTAGTYSTGYAVDLAKVCELVTF